MTIDTDHTLHLSPGIETLERDGFVVLIESKAPNWLATDVEGAWILAQFANGGEFNSVVRSYAERRHLTVAKAWHHVDTMVRDGLRQKLLHTEPVSNSDFGGRSSFLEQQPLEELWLHTNNSCNLACSHCLVSSGPDGDRGMPTPTLLDVLAQSRQLGVKRFYFTGGEPLLRPDLEELAGFCLSDPEAELAILSNGMLVNGKRLEALKRLDRERVRLQISIDGSRSEVNDPIRGHGSFEAITRGVETAVREGFDVTVTSAITTDNAEDVPEVTRLAARLGVRNHHLLWLHKRGRAADEQAKDQTPSTESVVAVVREAVRVGEQLGVTIDNMASLAERLNVPPGIKRDLSNACVTSLCVYADGNVYPSASMANVPELRLGCIHEAPLEKIWRSSAIASDFRKTSVLDKPICCACPFQFLCGGGDIEHSYFYGGSLASHDPYCDLHKAMIGDSLFRRAADRASLVTNGRSGFDSPVAFTGMGEGSIHCASGEPLPEILVSHSECVLSFEMDAPRQVVREFYGAAAEAPQEDLCCPVQPPPADIDHIPKEVLERFYGCGSPVGLAGIAAGETTLDLGSGAGIDVFIAARRVGSGGRAIGVDMTDEMLRVANESRATVATNLGYDVVEFLEGFLEHIPVDDSTVDLVTSNCVINLSPDKKRVFSEIWRVLKNHGRLVVSDIVSAEEVPHEQRRDPRLWGECISGALTEEEFLAFLERAGFYGVTVLGRTFWREVEGHRFFSLTVRGYKYEKQNGCVLLSETASYLGPHKGITDEEGHFFPRGVAVPVCTDTAAKLSRPPYSGMFRLSGVPDHKADDSVNTEKGDSCCPPTCC